MQLLPSPPPIELIALVVVSFLAGVTVPTYYAQERMRGFGRWVATRLPYEPPPGDEEGEALQAAVAAGERSPDGEQ